MNDNVETSLREPLEAVLMIVEEPVTVGQLATALNAPANEIYEQLGLLQADYDGESTGPKRGFQLRQIAGGWRIYARDKYAEVLERFMVEGASVHLSQAALEALAVIAYRQPATRAQVAQIRGVNSDSVVRTLYTRGLIEEYGTDPITQAVKYQTTPYFLELLDIDSIKALPKLSPMLPGVDAATEYSSEER